MSYINKPGRIILCLAGPEFSSISDLDFNNNLDLVAAGVYHMEAAVDPALFALWLSNIRRLSVNRTIFNNVLGTTTTDETDEIAQWKYASGVKIVRNDDPHPNPYNINEGGSLYSFPFNSTKQYLRDDGDETEVPNSFPFEFFVYHGEFYIGISLNYSGIAGPVAVVLDFTACVLTYPSGDDTVTITHEPLETFY